MAQRKRSLSFTGEPVSNKSFKLTHSPVPTSSRVKSIKSVLPSQSQGHLHKADSAREPALNIPVLAATILYAAFEHVDHWPAPLVKAYADDCFGSRSWVDDKRCRLLVNNLALAHQHHTMTSDNNNEDPEELISEAIVVADAYKKFEQASEKDDNISSMNQKPPTPAPSPPKGNNGASLTRSPPQKLKSGLLKSRKRPRDGDSSDSGDEEECALTVQVKNNGKSSDSGDGNSSSSGEEDEEVVVATNGASSPKNSASAVPAGSPVKTEAPRRFDLYPIQQRRLNLLRVRQRFFGANLDYAQTSISSSLAERLDVRSKQNSGLLQTLPSFTTVPAVRGMVAENLEKWLQSPALAGLARNLFSSTVQNMKNIDPPLDADLRAVDSIVGMRLKANQVR